MICARCLEDVPKTHVVEEKVFGYFFRKPLCPACRVFRKALAVRLVEDHDTAYPPGRGGSP